LISNQRDDVEPLWYAFEIPHEYIDDGHATLGRKVCELALREREKSGGPDEFMELW
jgi:hypothetical protein